ncbi:Hia/Hsf adhesin N-terminal domain-containing protein [Neisseria lactamica]
MNKIYRIIWNSALNAWVVVSELTRNHTKRASATATVAVLATLLSATAQASTGGAGGGNVPDNNFDPDNPSFDDKLEVDDNYKFGLVVVGKDGNIKTNFGTTDEDQGKVTISVEATESSEAKPTYKSSYLYLRENGGIEINQEGRSAKFKVKAGDGLKIGNDDKLTADTTTLTVTNGKVTAPTSDDDKKKLVNAGNLATTLNALGWQLKTTNGAAAAGNGTSSTVKNGDEVEFKGDGVEVTTTSTGTKHTVTIKAAQTQGANTGGSWKITAGQEDGGELDPANTTPTEQEVNTNDKVTLKAGDNLKIKQNGKDFTYSLKKNLTGLTGVETAKLSFGANGDKVNITGDTNGLNFAKETAGANGDTTVHLNGIGSTLHDTLLNSGATTNVTSGNVTDDEKKRAASVKDVLNAGWNIKGVKPRSTNNQVENIDFVATYDTVEFVSKDNDTTSVTVESTENGKRTEVKIGAKTSVIKEKDGKLVTGKKGAVTGTPNTTEDADEGKGLVTAETVIDAVNKAGWRIKTTDANGQNGNFTTVASGTNVTFANGNGTTATVTKNGTDDITVKYDVKAADGLKVDATKGIVADTTTLTVNSADVDTAKPKGKVADVTEDNKNKLVKADDLVTALNSLSWTATAGKDDTGEVEPTTSTEKEVKAGDKVTFKAGNNLKVKQDNANFTYSLKDELTGLTSITLGTDNDAKTVINKNGLTITPTNGAAAGTGTSNANTISVTTSGISAGNKEITNVKSGLTKYNGNNNDAKKDLVDLSSLTNTATVGTTNDGLANKAATVGDLAGLGWVLSAKKTTDETQDKEFHAAVKNATEVEFVGKNGATVSAKTGTDGKHTVTVDVATVEAGNGLEKDTTTSNTIKLKVKSKAGEENLLTVGTDGVSVTKGEFNTVDTTTPAGQGASADNRGKVTVKASNGTATADDKKKVATVGDVADAINSAATFVKVESTTDDIENDAANGNTTEDQALKAGDTLTFKAGKNLKAKLDKDGKSVTFALAKSIETDSAALSEKLSIGKGTNKVDITGDANGLKLAKAGNGNVHLNGLDSTLPDVTTNTGSSTSVTFSPSEIEKTRAATLKDVLNAGWNIKGAKVAGGNTENVDLVAGYDNVEFITGDKNTLDVVLTAKDNGKTTEVKFTPKTSVIKEKDGKLVTGQDGKDNAKPDATNDKDTGTGLVTAKAVIDAVNKSGWRVSGEGTTAENGATAVNAGNAETVTSGTSVNFKNGNATTATVSKDNGNINVKYDVNTGDGLKVEDGKVVASVGDGLKLDNQKIVADTTKLTVTDGKVTAPNGTNGDTKKLVDAGSLADALNKLSWKAKADKDTDGEAEGETDQEVKAGETVTFKAGKNLKVKQSGKDFTYSLKDELAGLTSITLGTAGNGKTTTKITENGLTVSTTPANGGTATEVKIGSDGISAGNKAITNVASGLKTYGDTQNGQPAANTNTAKNGLINLDTATTPANGGGTGTSVADTTAATVGDLRKLGWVLSSDKTTNDTGTTDTAFHAAVKNAEEVEFKGTGAATVSAKTENGKHTITVDVQKAEIETSDGIEKTNDGKIKLKVDNTDGNNVLTVDATKGASVTKGELEVASTDTGTNTADRGKVKVKGVNGTETENDKKKVATAVDVAKAINEAATFVKVQSSDEDIENDAATKDAADDQALKAGDTLTFKAGKNLKAKLDKDGKSVTFALAKSIETDSAALSKTLSIGENGNKVNITSDTKGLNFAKETAGTNGDTTVHLNGIGSTLHDTLSNTGVTTNLNGNGITDDEKKRAASVRDVLNVGWNIKGVKSNSATKQSENVDFVRTYDTVEFLSGSKETTTVTVDSEDNGKTTKVKIGAKTSVIKDHNGKLFTGKDLKDANHNGVTVTEADGKDEGKGLVTAEAVINAVNKAGWRIKTTAANGQAAQAGDNFETVASGTNVTFDNGNGTTASVTKDANGNGITVKYDVNVGDGLKVDDATKKIVADTITLTVNGAAANGAVDNTTPKGKVKEITSEDDKKKLVKAGDLVTALNSLSWTAKAGKDDSGESEGETDQEVKAGDKVTFKAGDNLKVKQSGKDFTYSLKKDLKDLTSVEFKDANGGTGASTKITNEGLTITPANGTAGTGAPNANTISVTKDGISVGGKTVKNVTSGLKTYDDENFDLKNNSITDLNRHVEEAYKGLLNLNEKTGTNKQPLVSDNTAATVGDLRKLGWVVSSKNGVDEKSYQVKQADEVLFEGKGGAKVTSTSANGKHTITIDVAETKVGNGLEKGTDGTIKLKTKAGDDNLLTVGTEGASVTKGSFEAVKTDAPNAGTTADTNRGKVTVSGVTDLANASDADKKKVATVVDVAKAINDAATFVKVESTEDDIEDNQPADNADQALKAGDTLTLKAGKNLKVKRDGKDVTFALAKDLDVKTAKVSDTLTIGGNIPTDGGAATPKVNITSTAGGLNFENAIADATGSKNVYLKGIATTLTEPSAGAKSSHVDLNVDAAKKSNAASIEDVLRAGWNIKGAKTVGGAVENVDFVSTYDTVEFASGANANVTVTTDANHKKTTVRVDVTGLPVQYVTEDDKTVVKVGNKYYEANQDGSADMNKQVENGELAKTKVKLVSASGKDPVKISNVADGTEDTDAVSFKQLKALQDKKITLSASNAYANGGADTDDGKATQTLSNGLNFKFKSADRELLKISADGDTVTFTPKKGSVQVGDDGKASISKDANTTDGLVEASELVESLNKLGWKVGTGTDGTGATDGTHTDTLVKSGDKVTLKAGDNLKVKQDGTNFTYALKDELTGVKSVEFKDAANGGASTKITKDGLTFTPATGANGGNVTDADKVKIGSDGISAGNKAVKNVVSGLKKFGDGHTLANGTIADFEKHNDTAYKGLTNLDEKGANKQTLAVADNTAATVGDLRGLGWVISADKTTGGSSTEYHDQVRNANEVKFKSGNGINVSGKTVNGTREITFELAKGEVVKSNEFTVKETNGTETNLVKVDDKYYSKEDIDPATGKPMIGKTEKYKVENGKIVSADGKNTEVTLTNKGSGYVTGNQVADAIAKSGFELGLADAAEAEKAFAENAKDKQLSKDKAETVNANDKVRFADGKNTKVSATTVESTDANGGKVTTTFVKTDVELPLTQIYNTDASGKKITKVVTNGQTKWYELKTDGTADTSKEVTLGNVDSDGKKVVKDNDKWYHAKADGTADTSTQAVDNSKVSTDEKHVVRLDPNNQSNGKGVVIDNVANGDISPTSKQAVNGSQIFALTGNKTPNITSITVDKDGKTVNVGTAGNANDTNKTYHNVVVGEDGKTPLLTTYNVEGRKEVITNSVVEAIYNMNEQGIKFFHSNDGKATSRIERSNEIDSSASGKFATAIGAKADAAGENAIAFGYGSKALRDNTVAIGTGNVVNAEKSGAFGDPNYIEDKAGGSYAFGNDNRITSKNTFVLGNGVNAKYKANGEVDTETVTVKDKDGKNTTVIVPKALGATVENSVYLGNKSTATKNPGSNLKSDGTAGNTTSAGATGTVNGFAGATAHGAVSVGASGEERRIQNVAAGEISATSTDAINGSQLYAATKGIADQAVGMVRALKRELEGVAAGANAAAALPQSYLPGKSMISAATGAYGSTGALAVGYSSISDNGKWVVKGQLNVNTRSKAGGGVGVGYIW